MDENIKIWVKTNKKILIIIACLLISHCACLISGCAIQSRRYNNTGNAGESSNDYSNAVDELDSIDKRVESIGEYSEQLTGESNTIRDRITDSQERVDTSQDGIADSQDKLTDSIDAIDRSLELHGDITTDSGILGDSTRRSREHAAVIEDTCRELEQLFEGED